jgi:hypothetical protein
MSQKLSQEELTQLTELQNTTDQITMSLGQIEIQKAILEGNASELLRQLADLQEKQNTIAKQLQDKYGDGNIDLKTGEFVASK